MSDTRQPVCAVVGVGPGNGAAVARRFAREGFAVALLMMKDKPETFFLKPDDLADSVFHVTEQKRSAWSFEVEARPFGENW